MVSLDDQAMARLLIAATAVSPEQFDGWLADIAARMERAARPKAKWRAYRDRKRRGELALRIVVDEQDAVAALSAVGALNGGDVGRKQLEAALTAQITDWLSAWRDLHART